MEKVREATQRAEQAEAKLAEEKAVSESRLQELQASERTGVEEAVTRVLQLMYFSKVCIGPYMPFIQLRISTSLCLPCLLSNWLSLSHPIEACLHQCSSTCHARKHTRLRRSS